LHCGGLRAGSDRDRIRLVLPIAFALGAFATTAKNMMYGFPRCITRSPCAAPAPVSGWRWSHRFHRGTGGGGNPYGRGPQQSIGAFVAGSTAGAGDDRDLGAGLAAHAGAGIEMARATKNPYILTSNPMEMP
jgi:hypothetical protein